MIRKLLITFLGLLASLFLIIGLVAVVSAIAGRPFALRPTFLSGDDWSTKVIVDASHFNLSVFQKLDRLGADRDGVYAIRETPLVMLSWLEFFSDKGGYRVTQLILSPAAAFMLAIVLGFFPAWVVLTPRLRRRSRRRRGECIDCGYNLVGNVTGTCPECGSIT